MILTGDLNSFPGSGVVDLIKKGKIDGSNQDFRDYLPKYYSEFIHQLNKGKSDVVDHMFLEHNFKFESVFEKDLAKDDKISSKYSNCTNYTSDFVDMIDYIFISPKIVVIEKKDILNEKMKEILKSWDSLKNNNMKSLCPLILPNSHFPSDHLFLRVLLELK